ncbi:hypothetical protein VTL71DRAFT_3235 [Oculimacula yallundae]|uniref:Uncharacterized protein n=1 Tax=Oculimacula yallundae TaxID=86028 RepID=A0ABR4C6J8_9HELO
MAGKKRRGRSSRSVKEEEKEEEEEEEAEADEEFAPLGYVSRTHTQQVNYDDQGRAIVTEHTYTYPDFWRTYYYESNPARDRVLAVDASARPEYKRPKLEDESDVVNAEPSMIPARIKKEEQSAVVKAEPSMTPVKIKKEEHSIVVKAEPSMTFAKIKKEEDS